jgi:hypothetical protein
LDRFALIIARRSSVPLPDFSGAAHRATGMILFIPEEKPEHEHIVSDSSPSQPNP